MTSKSVINTRGFTLTEMAIVLGIIGVIIGSIWTAAAMVHQKAQVSKAETQILTIAQNVRSLYAARQSMSAGDLTAGMINSNVFPSDMVNGVLTVNPWGTTIPEIINGVSISSSYGWNCDTAASGLHNQFAIIYWGVPKTACVPLLLTFASGAAAANGLVCAYSDGTGQLKFDSTDEANIEANCSGNVAFGFSLN